MVQLSSKWSPLSDKNLWMDNPNELLIMLEPILGNTGCLRSSNDVNLLVKVMETSCMLVTQCVVMNILKQTKAPSTLESFVKSRGWNILVEWLKIAKDRKDYSMIIEIIHLFIKFPVNIDNLKEGNVGRIVKQISKYEFQDVQVIAKRVLVKWKTLLKGYHSFSDVKLSHEMNKNKHTKLNMTIESHTQNYKVLSSQYDSFSASESFSQYPEKDTPFYISSKLRQSNSICTSSRGKTEKNKLDANASDSDKILIPDKDNFNSENLNESKDSALRFYGCTNSRISINKQFINRSESNSSDTSNNCTNNCLVQSKKFSEAFFESTSSKKHHVKRNISLNSTKQKNSNLSQINPNASNEVIFPTTSSNIKSIEAKDEANRLNRDSQFKNVDLKVHSLKKQVTWAPDEKLTEVRYIELDDTETPNVHLHTSFYDAIQQEKLAERNALARIFANDRMLALVEWELPRKIDIPDPLVVYGSKSEEKEIQSTRERSVLALLFLNKECAPDDPLEPDIEDVQTFREPKIIPHYEPGKEIVNDFSQQTQNLSIKEINASMPTTIPIFQQDKMAQLIPHSVLPHFCPLPLKSFIPNLTSKPPDIPTVFINSHQIESLDRLSTAKILSPKQEKPRESVMITNNLQSFPSDHTPFFKKSKYTRGSGRNTRYCQHYLRGFCKKAQNCNFIH